MIGIITHGSSPWLPECVESVARALPEEAVHVVREMTLDYATERFHALREFEYVGFVDADDLVYPGTIEACARALISSSAGVAFTQQERIDPEGRKMGACGAGARYLDVAMSPQAIHHFALIRREAVADEVLAIALALGVGIDWLMKANAALQHGAICVPRVGYGWRQHPQQDFRARDAAFREALPRLRDATLSWVRNNDLIPHYH